MHFNCLVFTQENSYEEITQVMNPYQENNFGTTEPEYLTPFYCKDDYYESYDNIWELKKEHPDAKTDEIGWENVNSKWDYWSDDCGTEMFVLKDGTRTNKAKLGDIDMDATIKFWKEKKTNCDDDRHLPLYAYVGPNGYWECCEYDSELFTDESLKKLITEARDIDPDGWATILDCHV